VKVAALVLLGWLVGGCAGVPTGSPGILFVGTPEGVAIEMLKLAAVTKDDVVYDLGSGDGRLVIAAAREFGARGVGVELDARLVQDSRESALKAGVADRTRFLWQDIFRADVAPATVVALYLSPKLNLELRPKLLRELRPGARIVSHDFDMADWPPARTLRVKGPTREHALHLWIVPPR
jgi:SAM-dependent methyltransferase